MEGTFIAAKQTRINHERLSNLKAWIGISFAQSKF